MKKTLFLMILSLILNSAITFGQPIDDRYGKPTDYLSEIKKHDLTELWAYENTYLYDTNYFYTNQVLGFIGKDYQRFYIHFISTIQNPSNHFEYFVYGKTKVKENICSFQGIITITKAKTFIVENNPKQKQGLAEGKYEFYEDPHQKGSGILKGNFEIDFIFDSIGRLEYGDIIGPDGYFNDRFLGTWNDYKSEKSMKCNWGYGGIPEGGSLTTGSAEFFLPDKKFAEYGWDNYITAFEYGEVIYASDGTPIYTTTRIAAQKKEKEFWWLDK
ncbi:MAG: hypothetical protein WCQ95_04955 [Bacteroidota bacterium]